MTVHYDLAGQRRIYKHWAPIYDRIYRRILIDAHKRTAQAAAIAGHSILEVGAGTGLVLRHYPIDRQVVGIDLSEDMLGKAAEKVRDLHLQHVKGLVSMDACRLGFRDHSFEAVTLPFVITLVPDPEQALTECARVLKPDHCQQNEF
jgi:phosphatidylethanolamine/phosphatidyl-N-methylethanolamine N-methyltransferase